MWMKILLWVAELVIELLRARHQDMAKTVNDMTRGYYEYETRLKEMRKEQNLYQSKLDSMEASTAVLKDKIQTYRILLGDMEAENSKYAVDYMNRVAEMTANEKVVKDL